MKNILFRDGIKWLVQLFVLLFSLTAISSHAIETITYYHTDSLGSPVAGTDESGALLWKEDYKPYGERIRKQIESDKNSRWYTGHTEDKETGLTYAGARHYDPVIGRFMAIDPVGFKEDSLQMFNRYAYANNNPYKYVDPDGNSPLDIAFLVVDAVKLTGAINSGIGIQAAAGDFAASLVGVISPIPGVGQGIKAAKGAAKLEDAVKGASKKFSKEKQALVDMAKQDKKRGITADDMQAYKDLNKELPDPFPSNKVRGPEAHSGRPYGKEPHGHVGPVNHIPIKKK